MGYNELTNSRAKSRPITLFLFQGDVSSEYQIENMLKGVTVIPGTTEFGYATTKITKDFGGGQIQPENWLSNKTESDMVVAIEQLLERAPNLEHVSLVVAWHGTDLRIGECEIKPKVERADKDTTPRVWQVAGVTRSTAEVVSYVDGYPAAGGAPADWSIYEAVVFLKSKGLRVTLYPFILMDIPPDNTLPDPYSDDAEGEGQPAFPWRGRITVSPAAGYVGTVDKTATAATQVSAFFGTAAVGDFAFNDTTKIVTYTGPDEWSFRRFILHMATIGEAAGADDFLIGSELVGITTIRSDASTYPSVAALKTLAADCRTILGGSVRIGYAADWSEYHSHRPGDGSNDVFFH
ncbi:MAG TPA: glycoside hydrolase TIM-barrel-like domain-containing protein, partial [Brevundimonas sp.]|nr:glycoside hydrolase TIM-barrel-like domain-containing protein [Brevundimonas sp.]